MQNHKDQNGKTKGFYILLALCVLVIGVSGYIFLSDAAQEQKEVEASLSVPVRTEPAEQTPGVETKQPEQAEQTTPALAQTEQTIMPVSGDVLQPYSMEQLSYNTTTRDWRTHNGVDLAAELGQSVKAARSGTVMAVYEDDYYGMTVALQHEDGYTTAYCGLAAEPKVAAGEQVKAGQIIGEIGGTALIETALDSHLHFEVCKNGVPVDPAGFLYN